MNSKKKNGDEFLRGVVLESQPTPLAYSLKFPSQSNLSYAHIFERNAVNL